MFDKKEWNKEYRQKNKERIKEYKREYYANNLDQIKEYHEKNKDHKREYNKEYCVKNIDKLKEKSKKYNEKNDERLTEYRKKYYIKNRERIINNVAVYASKNKKNVAESKKKYYVANKENICEYKRLYANKRNLNDPLFKLSNNIRCLIRNSFSSNKYNKKSKTIDILGCTIEEFKKHLESKFESWMNWSNHGDWNGYPMKINVAWDIDHIIPISTAKTEEDVIKLNHYTNFQPLCSYINRNVKRDNMLQD